MHAITFMMAFKVVWVYMESWLLKTLNEKLLALPFECALQTAQFVMTLGAAGFISFIQARWLYLILTTAYRVSTRITATRHTHRLLRLHPLCQLHTYGAHHTLTTLTRTL